jgi:hypothetical protein
MLEFIGGYVMGTRSAARTAGFARGAAAADAGLVTQRVSAVDDRVDRLLLVVEAMWTLLREQGLADEDLIERIRMLDEADGVADDRVTTSPRDCPSCAAKVAPGLDACQYCGAELPSDGPFRGL